MGSSRKSAAKSKPQDKSRASGSGSSSPRSTNGSCVERVGKYGLDTLPRDWDNCDEIRDRLRDDHHLLRHVDPETGEQTNHHVEGNVVNLKCNKQIVLPLAKLMAENGLLVPSLDRLIEACDRIYKIAKKPRSPEHCYQMAWACRRLMGTMKSFCYRPLPPEDPKLVFSVCVHCTHEIYIIQGQYHAMCVLIGNYTVSRCWNHKCWVFDLSCDCIMLRRMKMWLNFWQPWVSTWRHWIMWEHSTPKEQIFPQWGTAFHNKMIETPLALQFICLFFNEVGLHMYSK